MASLPTKDELELAAFSLSHFGSEVDSFELSVRSYVDEADTQPSSDQDHDAAAHVLAFTAGARDSIADALKDLEKLEHQALLVYESVDGRAYWQRVTTATIEDLDRLKRQTVSA